MITIGLDIDGTILENPSFFSMLSNLEDFYVYIITGRDSADHQETIAELKSFGIKFISVHYAKNWEDKGRLCKDLGIRVMFDDQDEYIAHIPEDILVMKPRNGGNWNYDKKDWMTKPPNNCVDKRVI